MLIVKIFRIKTLHIKSRWEHLFKFHQKCDLRIFQTFLCTDQKLIADRRSISTRYLNNHLKQRILDDWKYGFLKKPLFLAFVLFEWNSKEVSEITSEFSNFSILKWVSKTILRLNHADIMSLMTLVKWLIQIVFKGISRLIKTLLPKLWEISNIKD